MMNLLEEAIIYATILHQGRTRKMSRIPYILHPLEVAQILSTMTDEVEVIAAGVLHDVVEDTDGTLSQIRERFGERVAMLVDSETENKYPGEDKSATWKRRKEETLLRLKHSTDPGVKMLWLADKLANIRSLARAYGERGEAIWSEFHQHDTKMHCWYYKSVAENVEYELNRTGAYKELISHINYIWPGTFPSEKARYRKYKEVSVDGCRLIGRGAKGNIYRYDDELIIKVYHEGITYKNVEKEIELSRKAFVLGLPTAISFGIVAVGKGYGSMFELIDSPTVSGCIARSPGEVDHYAKLMAELARQIHGTKTQGDGFPPAMIMMREWVMGGVGRTDEDIAEHMLSLLDALPPTEGLIHGDFHTGNVLLQNGEPVLIDLDRMSCGSPIADLAGMYMFYVAFGEEDPGVVEGYMGFSYETAQRFFRSFLRLYLQTEDEETIGRVTDKAALLCYVRMISRILRSAELTEQQKKSIERLKGKIRELMGKVENLDPFA